MIDRDRGGRDSLQLGPTADKLFDALFSAKDCFPFTRVATRRKERSLSGVAEEGVKTARVACGASTMGVWVIQCYSAFQSTAHASRYASNSGMKNSGMKLKLTACDRPNETNKNCNERCEFLCVSMYSYECDVVLESNAPR